MKDSHSETTQTGVTIGTPEFMPPEQAAGRRDAVDARSDIWGLGATVFTAITGRYVHDDAQSLHEQLIASATRRSRPIRQLVPHVSPAVSLVIDRALELDMADRWQSARAMQLALRSARGSRSNVADESITIHAAEALEPTARIDIPRSYIAQNFPDQHVEPPLPSWDPPPSSDDGIEVSFEMTQAAPFLGSVRAIGPAPPPPPPPAPPPARMIGHGEADLGTVRIDVGQQHWPYGPPSARPPFHPGVGLGQELAPGPGRDISGSGGYSVIPGSGHPASGPSVPRRRSSHAVVIIALLLVAVCAAMGSYVLWRGSLPPVR
jgi:serine/threonine-protein kinase